MNRVIGFVALTIASACGGSAPNHTEAPQPPVDPPTAPSAAAEPAQDEAFRALERKYVVEFLRRNPTANTYLGGLGLDPSLAEADGRLRDHSKSALEAEDRWLASMAKEFEAASDLKSPALRIDREVALAQIRFLLHQHQVRHYQERSLDTYVDEPSRAVDFTLQGMTSAGSRIGTSEEWRRLAARLRSVGPYLKTAQENLTLGIASGRTPDARILVRNGLMASGAGVPYFETKFPAIAATNITDEPLLAEVREASHTAAAGYRDFHHYLATTFFDDPAKGEKGIKKAFAGDRFAMGEAEYDWALKNNLHLDTTAARLYEESWPVVLATRAKIVKLAREIGARRKLALTADDDAAVRTVYATLERDTPATNGEMFRAYRTTCFRLVDGARKAGLFDVPADYQLDIAETPEPLRLSITGAAYYPAPPFKSTGTGRFYMTPTDAKHQKSTFHEMADLCAHEAFPGHDWHYKTMTRFKDEISPLRWLTPGAVEDSSSMWADSAAIEGWGVYAETLIAEPIGDSPHGLLTPEEHLYVLRGVYFRDLRVRIDTGMHIGRLSYDDVVDLISNVPTFLTGSCRDPKALANPAKLAACQRAEQSAVRYARAPTQAVTYRLGRDAILAMREKLGTDRATLQRFHLAYMRQGTIPPGYFRDELLRTLH